jgi:hypothetical protein
MIFNEINRNNTHIMPAKAKYGYTNRKSNNAKKKYNNFPRSASTATFTDRSIPSSNFFSSLCITFTIYKGKISRYLKLTPKRFCQVECVWHHARRADFCPFIKLTLHKNAPPLAMVPSTANLTLLSKTFIISNIFLPL